MGDAAKAPGLGVARSAVRVGLLTILLFCFLVLVNLNATPLEAAWMEFARLIALTSDPLSASPPRLSDHMIEGLATMPKQEQAELLTQRAINHYQGAIEQIAQRVEGWRGHIQLSPQFSGMLQVALNSNDLRVRAAAIEVFLAAYDLPKDSGSFYQLSQRAQEDAAARGWALWMLGALGNRGVESAGAFDLLKQFTGHRDEDTRYWAISGLGLLGSGDTIRPLLDTLHNDRSPRIREHAACTLAQSGMLTHAQRMLAVPELLNYMDDASLDPATQDWVFQALRDITGQSHGHNPAAWRAWWEQYSRNPSLLSRR